MMGVTIVTLVIDVNFPRGRHGFPHERVGPAVPPRSARTARPARGCGTSCAQRTARAALADPRRAVSATAPAASCCRRERVAGCWTRARRS
ncbi:hypothetical protein QJS66_13595 [Kocuria rhizophila]|nr:hypothetical protein QJS66_13595 [Kocuria rhizophila]